MPAVLDAVNVPLAELRHQMMVELQAMGPHAERLKEVARCLPNNELAGEIRGLVTILLFRLTVLENRASHL